MLAGFAELVRAGGAGPVADVGCGPGRVTGYLNELGLPVFGIDLSPEMIAIAQRTYPGLRFEVGSMLALDLPDAALGGVLAWYSVIHIPDERVPEAFAEFFRVLAPGGLLLLAFQVGDEVVHVAEARGHPVALDYRWRRPEWVAEWRGVAESRASLAEGSSPVTRVVRVAGGVVRAGGSRVWPARWAVVPTLAGTAMAVCRAWLSRCCPRPSSVSLTWPTC